MEPARKCLISVERLQEWRINAWRGNGGASMQSMKSHEACKVWEACPGRGRRKTDRPGPYEKRERGGIRLKKGELSARYP